MALAAYRHILRSASIAFQGDVRVLHAARAQARNTFETHRSLPPTGPEVEAQIAHAESVARILKENVVQGQKIGHEQDTFREQLQYCKSVHRTDWLSENCEYMKLSNEEIMKRLSGPKVALV